MASRSTLGSAVRQAAAFDRAAVSVSGGLLAAIPVALVYGVCIAIGQPVAAVTAGVGAMLVGIAWRATGGRPPLGVMAADTLVMGLSTLVGCVTGELLWLHLVALAVWSLLGGMCVALGRRPGVVGFQAILAVVAFGRFTQPLAPALGLAGLVCAGGATQVAWQWLVRWPTPLAAQRAATATAFRALAGLALGSAPTSGLPAATALDEAAASLSAGSLLGAPAAETLRALVDEGVRMRVALTSLNGLAGRLDAGGGPAGAVRGVVVDLSWTLRTVAEAVLSPGLADEELARLTGRVTAAVRALHDVPGPERDPLLWAAVVRRLDALAGQLRAVAAMAPGAGDAGGWRGRRRRSRAGHPLRALRDDVSELLGDVSLRSPATRHALRLAVVVPGVTLLARELPVSRGYWVVIAAAAVLRPEFGATFTRGAERAGGTAIGVAIAGLVAAAVHPSGGVTVAIAGVLAWLGFATFGASYAVGFAFITALVVFLIETVVPNTTSLAVDRLIDTLIGGAIGLALFAAWPTWARRPAQESLAELTERLAAYLSAVLGAIAAGDPIPAARLRALGRAARLARVRADADVARSLTEPPGRRIDARVGPGMLAELLRVVQAAHALRLDAEDAPDPRSPVPALAPLARAIELRLAAVARALVTDDLQLSSEYADLREALQRFDDAADDDARRALLAVLDELVDAVDAVAELVARGARAPAPA